MRVREQWPGNTIFFWEGGLVQRNFLENIIYRVILNEIMSHNYKTKTTLFRNTEHYFSPFNIWYTVFFFFLTSRLFKRSRTRFNKKLPYTISNTFLRDRVKTTKILIDHLYHDFYTFVIQQCNARKILDFLQLLYCRIITNDALKLLFTTIDEIRFQLDDFKQREQIFIFSWGKGNEHTIFNLPVYKAPSLWVSERVGFACNKNGGQIIVLYEKRARDVEEIHHHRIPVW